MKKITWLLFILFSSIAQPQIGNFNRDSLLQKENSFLQFYSLTGNAIHSFPVNRINNITAFYPGVVSYYNNFHIRGGKNNETGFFLEGFKFNDLFSGRNSFLISPAALEEIEYSPGFIPADFGNTTSGLFNYRLKTGGEKFQMNVEQLTDNITFTSGPYSGNKRLGAYYYGYNEFNINAGGPLYLPNIRFFVNANYLFQRDKNPQRYPGVNETFADPYGDTVSINLPAGIVPGNYSESFNLISTFLFDLERIKINASAIYFNENEYAERNHILESLNNRNSQIQRDGGILNLKIENKINELISFSINGNYYFKKENTSDQYLGDDYWAYGDSVANAQTGIYWNRSLTNNWGRYVLPAPKFVYGYVFTGNNYPQIGHEKSEQRSFSLKGILSFTPGNHIIRAGGEISESVLRHWRVPGQASLAGFFSILNGSPGFEEYSEKQLKEYILRNRYTNNFGYNLFGDKIDDGVYAPPKPTITSLFVDDRFFILKNIYLYLGLRYDHFKYNYMTIGNPERPEETFNMINGEINGPGLKGTRDFSYVSPKIYLHHQLFNNFSYFVNFSRNTQNHAFSDLFMGLTALGFSIRGGFTPPVKTAEPEPVISSVFETGLIYNYQGRIKVQLNLYNKQIKNLPGIEYQRTSPFSPFSSYYYTGDNGSSDIKGIEFLLDYYYNSLKIISSLAYENGKESYNYLDRSQFAPFTVDITSISTNKINFKALLVYDFLQLQKISAAFNNMSLSILFLSNSGHPYVSTDGQNREISYAGTGVTPSVTQVDLKLEKNFTLFDNLNLGFYIYAINLFDSKNVYDVFSSTGTAEDDYRTANRDMFFAHLGNVEDPAYRLYRLINIDYNPNTSQQMMYGPPRQIGIGIKIQK